jgi:hypothetical protein
VIAGKSRATGGPCVTVAVGSERAVAVPAGFVSATAALSVSPTSAGATTYSSLVAPLIAVQRPDGVQCSHLYPYELAGVPLHVPVLTLSSCPSTALPEITGRAVFFGGTGATGTVFSEVASVEPAELLAVTMTRIWEPMSMKRSLYSEVVAETMLAHSDSGSQRCHW